MKQPKHVGCGLCGGRILLSHEDYVIVVYHIGNFICNRCREQDGHKKHPFNEIDRKEMKH